MSEHIDIDLDKHVMISKAMEAVIKKHLSERFSENEVKIYWNKVLRQYAIFLQDLPNLGKKKSRHNEPGGTYDCISIFAYDEVLNHEVSMEELYNMNCEVFLPEFKKMASIVNANNSFLRRLLHLAFVMTAKTDKGQDGGYIMKVEPFDKKDGVRYRFERCPIAEFAKAHGYLDIMPAFCNSDYPAMEYINAALIRKHTCANSDICDYWIVGDKSKEAQEHPRKTDEQGYWYND